MSDDNESKILETIGKAVCRFNVKRCYGPNCSCWEQHEALARAIKKALYKRGYEIRKGVK